MRISTNDTSVTRIQEGVQLAPIDPCLFWLWLRFFLSCHARHSNQTKQRNHASKPTTLHEPTLTPWPNHMWLETGQ